MTETKLECFKRAAHDVGVFVRRGRVSRPEAADILWRIAEAHGLVGLFGADEIQAILAAGFTGAVKASRGGRDD